MPDPVSFSSRRARRLVLLGVVFLGCGERTERGPTGPADSVPHTETASDTDRAYTTYLTEHGEDIAACFGEEIEIEGGGAADFEGAGGTDAPLRRLVIAVDASGSMAGDAGGQTKMEAAREAASDFLLGVSEDVEVGLVAFGHRGTNAASGKAASCAGVETVYATGVADEARIREGLGRLHATGWTPLAAAIERSGALLRASGATGEQVVYVVSDGEETCGGDPVAAARSLHEGGVRAIVNVIGFDLGDADRAQLRQVAEAGGGALIEVASAQELRDMGRRVRNSGELSRARVSAGGQAARNTVLTAGALNRLSVCVSGASSRETLGLSRFFGADRATPEVVADVRERLTQRHARYDALVERLRSEAEAERDVANRAIGDQLREIEREYGRLPEAQE